MKRTITETVEIPEGMHCTYHQEKLHCKKGAVEVSRKIHIPLSELKVEGNKIILHCEKGNQNQYKTIKSFVAHINNMFKGVENKFVYKLESVNVHFPMTLKVDGNKVVINNFLGEKVPRHAKILPGVEVDIKGQKITVSSHDREAAGQTAANLEKATKVRGRDRRIYQDGIFIVEKPGRLM